jgi:hypothetical protein
MSGGIAAGGLPAGGRRALGVREVLALCAAFSLAAHLFVLSVKVPMVSPRQAPHVASMALRLVSGKASDAVAVSGIAALRQDAPKAEVEPEAVEPHRQTEKPRVEASPNAKPHRDAVGAAASSPSEPDGEAPLIAAPHAASKVDDYVPRPLLSVAPVALAPVLVEAPPDDTEIARRVGILSLFIDDEGKVQRIEAEEPSLPEAFEQAARDAFMAVRFSPGQVEGRAVKSRVRVEVVFDNTPLTGP